MYYDTPAALGSGNETNFLTIRYPILLRSACMMRAYEHMKQTALATGYMQKAMADINEANVTSDMARRGQYVTA